MLLMAGMLLCSSGVFSGATPETKIEVKSTRVGLALPTLAEERWHRDLAAMSEIARDMGIDLLVQVTMNDQNQQNFNIEQLITNGIDVLIVAPHDSFGVGRVVENAHNAGIKVISYDRLIMNADVDLYVSYDNLAIGKMQGKFLAENAKEGKYIVLGGPKYDSNARFYKQGAMTELRELMGRGKIDVVMDRDVVDWNPNTVKELVETALIKHPEGITAILTPNDGMASGAIAALKHNNLDGKVVVTGQDADVNAAKRIMAGSQAMTVFKDISKEAEAALNAALLLAQGEDILHLTEGRTVNNLRQEIPAILLTPVLLDRSNLNEVLKGNKTLP